jgi:hypothetical protein
LLRLAQLNYNSNCSHHAAIAIYRQRRSVAGKLLAQITLVGMTRAAFLFQRISENARGEAYRRPEVIRVFAQTQNL